MKLGDYMLNEAGRGRPRKTPSIDQMDGKDAEKNGSGGTIGVNEPVDKELSKEIIEEIPKEQLNKNMKQLLKKFEAEHDFFIMGRAGWGKTSIIEDMAARYHREVINVYLDKVAAVDLGGIPVPERGKRDVAYQKKALPKWAYDLFQAQAAEKDEKNPKRKFLLFFDEMNQARPDVMNALMPIVLKHEVCEIQFYNFFVGAAGNFDDENDVNELSGPLASRFAPIIIWRTDEEAWRSAFDYLHKKWDDRVSKDMVTLFDDNHHLFKNPREIEMKILDFIWKLKKSPRKSYFDVDDYLDQLEALAKEERTKSEDESLGELAEQVYEYINDDGTGKDKEDSGRSSGKGIEMVHKNVLDAIRFGMKHGYVHPEGSDKDYGMSRENVWIMFDGELANKEIIQRVINKFEAEGIKFKYETDDEWKKAGYADPSQVD